jgi:hypothetical protein
MLQEIRSGSPDLPHWEFRGASGQRPEDFIQQQQQI